MPEHTVQMPVTNGRGHCRMSGIWGGQTELDLYLQSQGYKTLFFGGVNADQASVSSLLLGILIGEAAISVFLALSSMHTSKATTASFWKIVPRQHHRKGESQTLYTTVPGYDRCLPVQLYFADRWLLELWICCWSRYTSALAGPGPCVMIK